MSQTTNQKTNKQENTLLHKLLIKTDNDRY